jgi:Anti-sigma-K factor rskA, C-terminal
MMREANRESGDGGGPEVEELRAVLEELSLHVPAPGADPDVDTRIAQARGRLLARVRADSRRSSSGLWLVAALAASIVAAAILWRKDLELTKELVGLRATVTSSRTALDSAATALAAAQRQLDITTGPQVAVVSLAASGAGARAAASALMFWDRSTNTWSMYARDLPVAPAGRTYELWLVTKAGKKIPAGTFNPSPAGTAHVEAKYTLDSAALAAVAVTEEPTGGVESPTGPVVIAGSPLKPGR